MKNAKLNEKKKLIENKIKIEKLTSNLNLSTSKQNYIDPRITFSFCKKFNIDISKFYTSLFQGQVKWAETVSSNWKF